MKCDYGILYNWPKMLIADVNECETQPCQNDGTCEDQLGAYACDCVPGYTDIDCSTGQLS